MHKGRDRRSTIPPLDAVYWGMPGEAASRLWCVRCRQQRREIEVNDHVGSVAKVVVAALTQVDLVAVSALHGAAEFTHN